jgi:hypothetical protein
MKNYRPAKKRVEVSVAESVRILLTLCFPDGKCGLRPLRDFSQAAHRARDTRGDGAQCAPCKASIKDGISS